MDEDLLQNTQNIIKSLIISCQHEITIEELSKDYREQEGQNIPYRQLGYQRLNTFLLSFPDINIFERGTKTFVTVNESENTKHLTRMISKSKIRNKLSKPGIRDRVNNRNNNYEQYQTRESSSNNISKQSISINDNRTSKEINNSIVQYGSNSLHYAETKQQLPQTSFEPKKKILDTMRSSLREKNIERYNLIQTNQYSSDIRSNPNNTNRRTDCSNYNFKCDFKMFRDKHDKEPYASIVEPIDFIAFAEIDRLYNVFIAEINSPNRFWFYLASEFRNTYNLMHNIKNYYASLKANELLINKNELKHGQICCAKFYGIWHRGEIVSDLCKTRVKIYFLDYGTTMNVPFYDIKYLLYRFAKLPRQAIAGNLYGITSIEDRWMKDSSHAMLEMTKNLKLYCRVKSVDKKTQTISMILYDTNKPMDIIINNELIKKNFARMIKS